MKTNVAVHAQRPDSWPFEVAVAFDDMLELDPRDAARLRRRQVRPRAYDRGDLFKAMAKGEVRLFSNFPAPVHGTLSGDDAARGIYTALRRSRIARKFPVRCGRAPSVRYMTFREFARRWRANRGCVNIPDYQIRNTPIERIVDPNYLGRFNLFPKASDAASTLEMMSIVVSSRGAKAISHSDDPDGSNHCFIGSKLWLMWDTFEGLQAGLEDCERLDLAGAPRFDLQTYLGLRSSRWLHIRAGQTMFLPGSYSHRVITLERYVGTGSFYFGLPNALRTLSRWLLHGTSWAPAHPRPVPDSIMDDLALFTRRRILDLASRTRRTQYRMGYLHLPDAVAWWRSNLDADHRSALLGVPSFRKLAGAMGIT